MSYEDLLGCYALVYDPDVNFYYYKNQISVITSYRYDSRCKVDVKLHPLEYNDDLRDYIWTSITLIKILGHPERNPLVKLLYSTKININK